MSKLEALIQELCPNGVEYKTLSEVATIVKGKQLNKDGLFEEGLYPVINGGINPSGYWNEYNFSENLITISQGGASAGYVNFLTSKFWAGAHCYVVERCEDIVDYRYLYHVIKMNEFDLMNSQIGAGIPSVSLKDLGNVIVPVPPLEVQREIVQILDKFTLLTAELTAELTARKQQYEHYRDSLLSFNSEIKNLPLNDIMISIKDGSHNPPKDAGYATNLPMISAQNINNGIIDFTNVRFLTDSDFTLEHKRTNIQRNDVLLTIVGAVGRVAVVNTDKKFTCQRSVCILKPNCELIDSEYLKFILESSNIQNYFINNSNGAAQKGIYLNQIKNIMIPVPSLEIQKRLVKVLNNFDKICSDLGIGLPAEIEARQQQYEYYRSKLLTMVAEVVNFKASKQASKQAR